MDKPKISRENAEAELTAWLDQKKVFQSVREGDGGKQNIEDMIGFIMQGILEVNDDGTLKHNLVFPLGEGQVAVRELSYKQRLNDRLVAPYLKGVSPSDAFGMFIAYAAAATDQPKNILNALDSGTDRKVMQAIVFFFI